VVRDVRQQRLGERPGSDLFVPIFQAPRKRFTVLVRTRGDPNGLARSVRKALAVTSPEIGVSSTTALTEIVANSIWVPRLWASLLGTFSLLALLLAAAGTYGVIGTSVEEKTREIGVRMALGARRETVLLLLLRQGLGLALIGAALGLACASQLSGLLAHLVFGIDAGDPRILLEVAAFLVATVVLASWLATRKATRVDPLIALRYD
jgi:putative ABC transport system permease protein